MKFVPANKQGVNRFAFSGKTRTKLKTPVIFDQNNVQTVFDSGFQRQVRIATNKPKKIESSKTLPKPRPPAKNRAKKPHSARSARKPRQNSSWPVVHHRDTTPSQSSRLEQWLLQRAAAKAQKEKDATKKKDKNLKNKSSSSLASSSSFPLTTGSGSTAARFSLKYKVVPSISRGKCTSDNTFVAQDTHFAPNSSSLKLTVKKSPRAPPNTTTLKKDKTASSSSPPTSLLSSSSPAATSNQTPPALPSNPPPPPPSAPSSPISSSSSSCEAQSEAELKKTVLISLPVVSLEPEDDNEEKNISNDSNIKVKSDNNGDNRNNDTCESNQTLVEEGPEEEQSEVDESPANEEVNATEGEKQKQTQGQTETATKAGKPKGKEEGENVDPQADKLPFIKWKHGPECEGESEAMGGASDNSLLFQGFASVIGVGAGVNKNSEHFTGVRISDQKLEWLGFKHYHDPNRTRGVEAVAHEMLEHQRAQERQAAAVEANKPDLVKRLLTECSGPSSQAMLPPSVEPSLVTAAKTSKYQQHNQAYTAPALSAPSAPTAAPSSSEVAYSSAPMPRAQPELAYGQQQRSASSNGRRNGNEGRRISSSRGSSRNSVRSRKSRTPRARTPRANGDATKSNDADTKVQAFYHRSKHNRSPLPMLPAALGPQLPKAPGFAWDWARMWTDHPYAPYRPQLPPGVKPYEDSYDYTQSQALRDRWNDGMSYYGMDCWQVPPASDKKLNPQEYQRQVEWFAQRFPERPRITREILDFYEREKQVRAGREKLNNYVPPPSPAPEEIPRIFYTPSPSMYDPDARIRHTDPLDTKINNNNTYHRAWYEWNYKYGLDGNKNHAAKTVDKSDLEPVEDAPQAKGTEMSIYDPSYVIKDDDADSDKQSKPKKKINPLAMWDPENPDISLPKGDYESINPFSRPYYPHYQEPAGMKGPGRWTDYPAFHMNAPKEWYNSMYKLDYKPYPIHEMATANPNLASRKHYAVYMNKRFRDHQQRLHNVGYQFRHYPKTENGYYNTTAWSNNFDTV